jgi:hypothetical protein
MAENYYLFFKPLPVGDHTIELYTHEIHLVNPRHSKRGSAKWDVKVTLDPDFRLFYLTSILS